MQARDYEARDELRTRKREERLVTLQLEIAVTENISCAGEFKAIAVPCFDAVLAPVTNERADRLREHLERLAAEVESVSTNSDRSIEEPNGTSSDTQPHSTEFLPVLMERICATCQGHCCKGGDNHGHLASEHLRDYWEQHPNATREEIVSSYQGYVPEEACADSCIFHGAEGCQLPREMRSRVCVEFQCGPLTRATDLVRRTGVTGVFIASMDEDELKRYQFVTSGHP